MLNTDVEYDDVEIDKFFYIDAHSTKCNLSEVLTAENDSCSGDSDRFKQQRPVYWITLGNKC